MTIVYPQRDNKRVETDLTDVTSYPNRCNIKHRGCPRGRDRKTTAVFTDALEGQSLSSQMYERA
jgi:hypothetical protein